jgi:hypothetical protein
VRILLALIALFSLGLPLSAQESKVSGDDIATLLDFGYEDAAILDVLAKPDHELVISAEDLPKLTKKGAGPDLIAYLRKKLPAPPRAAGMSVKDVLALWKSSKDGAVVAKRIIETDSRFELSIEDFLAFSQARLPYRVIDLMKKRRSEGGVVAKKPRPASAPLELDDLVRLSRDGVSDEDIVTRIRASQTQFPVQTEDILRLEREGVSIAVLREVYARRQKSEVKAGDRDATADANLTGNKSQAAKAAGGSPEKAVAPKLRLYAPKGGAFSMLAPEEFVTSERFTGRKMLVQMVDSSAAEREDLPDLELSVLVGRTRDREKEGLTHANLEPMANKLMKSVAAGFRRDGIVFVTRKPQPLHLAGRPALRYPTSATTASGTGHVGASFVLFAGNQVLVISYSARQEMSAHWREHLEICARSLSLRDETPILAERGGLSSGNSGESMRRLFTVWRDSIRHFDFASHAAVTPETADRAADRLRFVRQALALEKSRNRIEFDRLDMAKKEVHYKIFGIDGKKSAALQVEEGADGKPRLRHP